MNISDTGIALIKRWEGRKLQAYQDSGGVWTIGYGHTKTAQPGMVITGAQAEALLRQDIAEFEGYVRQMVKSKINQNQFDALVSFTFNLGPGALQGSTLLSKVNARPGDPSIRDEFPKWRNVRINGALVPLLGLERRRKAEADLYFGSQKKNVVDPINNLCRCPHCGGGLLVGPS